jgi:hypothetical protein
VAPPRRILTAKYKPRMDANKKREGTRMKT